MVPVVGMPGIEIQRRFVLPAGQDEPLRHGQHGFVRTARRSRSTHDDSRMIKLQLLGDSNIEPVEILQVGIRGVIPEGMSREIGLVPDLPEMDDLRARSAVMTGYGAAHLGDHLVALRRHVVQLFAVVPTLPEAEHGPAACGTDFLNHRVGLVEVVVLKIGRVGVQIGPEDLAQIAGPVEVVHANQRDAHFLILAGQIAGRSAGQVAGARIDAIERRDQRLGQRGVNLQESLAGVVRRLAVSETGWLCGENAVVSECQGSQKKYCESPERRLDRANRSASHERALQTMACAQSTLPTSYWQ